MKKFKLKYVKVHIIFFKDYYRDMSFYALYHIFIRIIGQYIYTVCILYSLSNISQAFNIMDIYIVNQCINASEFEYRVRGTPE